MKLQECKALLKKELPKLKGTYFCPCLMAYVTINSDSIKEIINHACISEKSTLLALNSKSLIENKNAIVLFEDTNIKKGNQTKKFNLQKLFVIKSKINIGTAKLTIGLKKSGKHVEYCVTSFYK